MALRRERHFLLQRRRRDSEKAKLHTWPWGTLGSLLVTPSSGCCHTPEGRDGAYTGMERWDCANLRRFNRAKGKVLHLGWDNPKHKSRLGMKGGRALRRRIWRRKTSKIPTKPSQNLFILCSSL